MRLAGGEKPQHRGRIVYEVSAVTAWRAPSNRADRAENRSGTAFASVTGELPVDAVIPNDRCAVERICRHLRSALGADAVAVWSESPWCVVASTGHPVPHPADHGVHTAPIVYGVDPVAQLTWRRSSTAGATNLGLVAAAVDIAAPLVASCLTLADEAPADPPFGLVGVSAAIARLRASIPKVASVLVPVLAILPAAGLAWLAVSRRRRADRKHAGLRILR